ncbi:hypothetical protein SCACP_38130 [Sporomusa carbonis]|uniref:hypothetical protein n=1 Tax=Sporomusa carbonis TaxID=3076075 RepID=UPI003A73AD9C
MLYSDWQDILITFIYTNLPVLMNPANAANVVITSTPEPTTSESNTLFISPGVLPALQTYVFNNFPELGLPSDIEEVAKDFFANLSPANISEITTTSQ